MVSSGPIGAAPCETQGRISTPSKPHADRAGRRRPRRRAAAACRRRASAPEASPPRSGSIGARRGQLAQHRVGRERERDRRAGARRRRRQVRHARSARRRRRRAPRPRRGTASRRRRRAPRPRRRPRCPPRPRAARRSRRPRRSRRARPGASVSCTASSVASGAARCPPETNTTARSHVARRRARRAPRPPPRRRRSARPARREPAADAYAHVVLTLPRRWRRARAVRSCAPCRRCPSSRCSGPPAWARPRSRSRSPSGCAPTARIRSPSRPTRSSSTRASRCSPAPRAPSERARLEHRLLGDPAVDRARHGRRLRPPRPRRDRRAARRGPAPDRRRRHRPVPARGAGRARPAPAARPAPSARATPRGSRARARPRCTPSSPRARPSTAAASAERRAAHRPRAGAARRRRTSRRGGARSCGRPRPRQPTLLVAPRRWSARRSTPGSTPASRRWSPPAPSDEVRARRRRRRLAVRPPGARLRRAAARRRRRRCSSARAATPSASSPGCASCPGTLVDLTGRDAQSVAAEVRSALRVAADSSSEPMSRGAVAAGMMRRRALREMAGAGQRLPDRRGAALSVRADARGVAGSATATPAPARRRARAGAARRPRLRRPPADLQPRRLGGRAVRQRRTRGDPLPAPPGWTDADEFSIQTSGGRDPPDDHSARRPAASTWAAPACAPRLPVGRPGRRRRGGRRTRFQHVCDRQPAVRDPRRRPRRLEALDLPAIGPAIEHDAAVPQPHERLVLVRRPGRARSARGSSSAAWGRRCPPAPAPAARPSRTCCAAATRPSRCALDGGELEVDVDESLHVDLTGWAVPVYAASSRRAARELLRELACRRR